MDHLFRRYVIGRPRRADSTYICIDGSVFDLNKLPTLLQPPASHSSFMMDYYNQILPEYVLHLPGHEDLLRRLLNPPCLPPGARLPRRYQPPLVIASPSSETVLLYERTVNKELHVGPNFLVLFVLYCPGSYPGAHLPVLPALFLPPDVKMMLCFSVNRMFKEEYNDDESSLQGKEKDENSLQGNSDKGNFHDEDDKKELPPSNLQKNDGNRQMVGVHEDPEVRHNSSTFQVNNGNIKWLKECQDKIPPEKEMKRNTQDKAVGNWFKITIPYGVKYNKTWLMNSVQSHCSVPFTPIDFHYIRNRAQFFVQDSSIASALKDVNNKICDEEKQKISIFVNPCAEPNTLQNKFTPEKMEKLMLTMNKRYDVSQQALDLQKLRFDPELRDHDIDMILNRRQCMAATLQIIERNFPELLSLNLCNNKLYWLDGLSDIVEKAPQVKRLNLSKNELRTSTELDKLKGLKLEELWLEGNPLCSAFPDQSAYVSAIQDCFPKLLRLDGQDLPVSIVIDSEAPEIIRPCKESYKGSDNLKSLLLQFLLQYYLIYDYGDRQGLLDAYHDEACFSLTIPFNPEDPDPNSLEEYFKDNRNIKKHKDPFLRMQLLKHTKYDIVNCISILPKTQHDFNSYVVDLCVQTEMMLCFSVNGLFKEVEGKSQGSVRAFTRTFILTSGSNSSLCIVNDEMIVRNASPKETQSAFSIPMLPPSSSYVPDQEQQGTAQPFSTQSEEQNLKYTQKCLEDKKED
ncbi:nuclear RNA export factor 2-like [Sciurus carolinensis]|uniref:nuclear RNA export factor 2-like n=1 Tax=Sciurus carolinensis TaxID=30640 RepID=UPI001FB4C542|nr:nuclear RNA export factor 2-like [Sciurus carolinensis]